MLGALVACSDPEFVVVTVKDPEARAVGADELRIYGMTDEPEVRSLEAPFPVTFALTHPEPIRTEITVEAREGRSVVGRAGVVVNFARGSGVTAILGRPCGGNGECDDDLFCNGRERCLDGVCVPGVIPCVLGANQCVTARCDEERDACVVAVDPNLDDRELCTIDTCGSDGPVHAPLPDGELCDWFGVVQSGVCTGGTCGERTCDGAPDLQPCTHPVRTAAGICSGGTCVESRCGDGVIDGRFESCENLPSSVCQSCVRQSDVCTPNESDVPCETTLAPVKITLGRDFSCALTNDGTVWCWGSHAGGALGIGDIPPPHVFRRPFRVSAQEFRDVSAGEDHVCGISGDIWCWGDLRDHGLALATSPVQVPDDIGVVGWERIVAGDAHTCAITEFGPPPNDRALYCWGENSDGRLGLGDTTDRTAPTYVSSGWLDVCTGGKLTCGIRDSDGDRINEVWCFGSVAGGGLQASNVPVQVSQNDFFIGRDEVLCGTDFVCFQAPTLSGRLGYAWQCLGNAPVGMIGSQDTTFVAAGGDRVCRGLLDGSVQCSDPAGSTILEPQDGLLLGTSAELLSGERNAIDVSNDHFCGIDGRGDLWCSGANGAGQLGMGHTNDVNSLERTCCLDF